MRSTSVRTSTGRGGSTTCCTPRGPATPSEQLQTTESRPLGTSAPVLLIVLTLVGAAGAVVGQVVDAGTPVEGPLALSTTVTAGFLPTAAFVLGRLPRHPIGRLMLATGMAALVALL